MTVVSARHLASADRFFERTADALALAAARSPRAYGGLEKDLRRIVLVDDRPDDFHQRFQLAVLIWPGIAFDAGRAQYAAWLLWASGLTRGDRHAAIRLEEFLAALDPDQRGQVRDWVRAVARRAAPPAT